MKNKIASVIFLLTSISILLGGFGHGSQWMKHVRSVLTGVDDLNVRLLALIWYWVSGAMVVFGVVLLWTWWRIGRGERNLLFVPGMIAAFYLVEGLYGVANLGAFFLVFVAQALLLAGSAWALQNAPPVSNSAQNVTA